MAINFQPDQVNFGDAAGYGMWQNGHHREHLVFVQAFATQATPILLPNYDFLSFLDAGAARRSQLEAHAKVHALMAPLIGATAVDFSGFNLDDEGDFYAFLGAHATTHAQIRQFLGI